MSSAIARKRAEKAARRKKLLADRHKSAAAEPPGSSLAAQVRRLASAPIEACLVQDTIFAIGSGMVALVRKPAVGRLAVAFFMVDSYCLGVKDAFFRQGDSEDIESAIGAIDETVPFSRVEPSYARKLLRDVVAWSRTLGIEPDKDYAAIVPFFGTVSADDCGESFTFGLDGKPHYVPGPGETAAQIRRRTEMLRRRLGDAGFDLTVVGEFEDEDFDEGDFIDADEPGYDPDVAPDPAAWLALDEGERLFQVKAHHRRAEIELPNERVHAAFHLIVENQVAIGDELPVRRAIDRLIEQSLGRHEAIHAVMSRLADYVFEVMRPGEANPPLPEAYFAAVEKLTVADWRNYLKSVEDDEGGEI